MNYQKILMFKLVFVLFSKKFYTNYYVELYKF